MWKLQAAIQFNHIHVIALFHNLSVLPRKHDWDETLERKMIAIIMFGCIEFYKHRGNYISIDIIAKYIN